jgi:hypothetical protein
VALTWKIVSVVHLALNAPKGFGWPLYAENSIFLSRERVIVDEKFLELSDELLTQLADVINVAKTVVGLFDSNEGDQGFRRGRPEAA